MDEARIDNATRTVVPIWAVEALMANAIDVLNLLAAFDGESRDVLNIPYHIHHR